MKVCLTEGCDNLVEGNTEFCSSHNREHRRVANERIKAQGKREVIKVTTKQLKDNNLWIPFSKFIRLRDSDKNGICVCFTCGKKQDWNSGGMEAGHFIGRRHWSTRYYELNVHAQCHECNHYNGGMQYEYSIKLDERYGEGTAMKIRALSKEIKQMSQYEIDELAAHYRSKVRQLLTEKD